MFVVVVFFIIQLFRARAIGVYILPLFILLSTFCIKYCTLSPLDTMSGCLFFGLRWRYDSTGVVLS